MPTTNERALPMRTEIDSPRMCSVAGADSSLAALIRRLIDVSCVSLPTMFRGDQNCFAFTRIRGRDGQLQLRGESPRYGGIALLGARWLDEATQRAIFHGETAYDFCERLVLATKRCTNLGDLAVVAWAAAELQHPRSEEARERMLQLADSNPGMGFTVELAWTLSALAAAAREPGVEQAAQRVHATLMTAFSADAGVFAHNCGEPGTGGLRSHVACFADQVYPIQALSRFHKVFGDQIALEAADRCAEQICRVQGEGGQWWWHYDARTGSVIEGYPVYSVHQDSMGPMALLDLAEAGGRDYSEAIRLGLRWMERAAELGVSLIDDEHDIIWRKIGRTDPQKLVRRLRAVASRVHPNLHLGLLDSLFPTSRIDYESRPYHLGWVLHTWLGRL